MSRISHIRIFPLAALVYSYAFPELPDGGRLWGAGFTTESFWVYETLKFQRLLRKFRVFYVLLASCNYTVFGVKQTWEDSILRHPSHEANSQQDHAASWTREDKPPGLSPAAKPPRLQKALKGQPLAEAGSGENFIRYNIQLIEM